MKKNIIIVRGGGDIATGTIYKLHQSGYPVLVTEIANPSAIRRQVAFSEAVYEKSYTVEGVTCYFAENLTRAYELLKQRKVALMIDPDGAVIREVKPAAVVDGILAKKNLGTKIEDAPIVIGVGPGFTAGIDCHFVVETKRGHDLGRVITEGTAIPNTGVPGMIAGYAKERLICASGEGRFEPKAEIGDCVEKGQLVAMCGKNPVYAQMSGMIRGMLPEGIVVSKGMKCGDIDARREYAYCFTISDKARAVGGGVLEAILRGRKQIAENRNREFDA